MGGGDREEQMPPMSGGGERFISIVAISRNTEVERGALVEQMAKDQRRNSNKEDSVKNSIEQRKLTLR